MSDQGDYKPLTREENLAAALNVASDNSIAYAQATQTAPITQTN
jgi:hypothetical protein